MIQMNLVPDVKLDYLRKQRLKRFVVLGCFLTVVVSSALIVVMTFMVFVWDKKSDNDLDRDLEEKTYNDEELTELNKALTIKYQLDALDTLHTAKPVSSRTLDMMNGIRPANISFSKISIDFASSTLQLNGVAADEVRYNEFVNTLKFAQYYLEGDEATKYPLFSNVKAGDIAIGIANEFKLELNFDAKYFDRAVKPIPYVETGKATTNSDLEKPQPLLIEKPNTEEDE